MLLRFLFLTIVILYGGLFLSQEQQFKKMTPQLSTALPAPIQEIALGYLKEVGAEILYIKTAVFLGRNDLPKKHAEYAGNLAQNFQVMTDIYPEFIDPYYFCEAYLAYVNEASAISANEILSKGVNSHSGNIIFPFFIGFNYFYYLDQPIKAAAIFSDLASRQDAPTWFAHLASVLSARGGDLYGGLMTLRAVLSTEKDKSIQERYRRDIMVFERAIQVHEAVEAYFARYGHYPDSLQVLVPEMLDNLPQFEDGYSLNWDPPELKLLRPIKKGEE